jgi:DnaJ-domain-containing protein 1
LIPRLIILAAIAFALWWFLRWFRRTPPAQVAAGLRRAALYGVIALVVLAAATGRLNPLFAVVAAAIPFVMRAINVLRVLPAVQQVLRMLGVPGVTGAGASGGGASGQTSSIRTQFLEMTLEHATGRMDGRILEGPNRGRLLSELTLNQLLELLAHCRSADAQSAAVLEAYLDRVHGDRWRDRESPGERRGGVGGAKLSREDAFAILGLKPGASPDEVRDAHRRLMQKLHPDRGGSDYLAAKINAAKQLLLEE